MLIICSIAVAASVLQAVVISLLVEYEIEIYLLLHSTDWVSSCVFEDPAAPEAHGFAAHKKRDLP